MNIDGIFNKNRITLPEFLLHFSFWGLYFVYPILQCGVHSNCSVNYMCELINLFFGIGVVYSVYLWLLPYISSRKIILKSIFPIALGLIFLAFMNCKIQVFVTQCNCSTTKCIFGKWLHYTSLIGIFSALFFFKKYQQKEKEAEIAKQEKHLSELETLKAQINPHFILNTLNAIYSYSVVNKKVSPGFSKLIYQFSENLKYVVYESEQEKVPLGREVMHIENFVRLQEFRLEDKITVNFKKNISNKKLTIPPLLLINFVENSFKHTNDLQGKNHKIEILIKEQNGRLEFICKNPCHSSASIEGDGKGIGIKNTRKRLQLLFPEKHDLSIKVSDQKFVVELTINLT